MASYKWTAPADDNSWDAELVENLREAYTNCGVKSWNDVGLERCLPGGCVSGKTDPDFGVWIDVEYNSFHSKLLFNYVSTNLVFVKILGLPDKVGSVLPASRLEMDTPGETQGDMLRKQQEIPLQHQHLSPRELLVLSVKYLAEGHKDRAMPLLRLALDKDPEYVRAVVVMGQTLLNDGQLAEAADYLERAISKLFLSGHPTEVEEVDLLILASLWVGIACIRQGKTAKGIRHLERVANWKEPEDAKSKAHYLMHFWCLLGMNWSDLALYNERRRLEAVKLLRMAAAYDSSYKVYLEQCEKDEVDLVRNLDGSKRGDN
ncbi:hypothetical protein RHMOL_Rhmol10G0205800 [Rhododendron molle]|uniref:Uncharacterized protein n=1 Tax=Rhododendron molle TaxID=49168 RepID=A0ACC0M603_RHOML|nr:hypothetical protein RHMOL_Rhmol10G0205800 [Rhododendron molle]